MGRDRNQSPGGHAPRSSRPGNIGAIRCFYRRRMAVVMAPWPTQEVHRSTLSSVRRPRLLLVDPGVPAPRVTDVLEDWVRLPATDEDGQAGGGRVPPRAEA